MRPATDQALVRRSALRLGLLTGTAVAVIVGLLTAVAVLVVLHGQRTAATLLLEDTVSRADNDVDDPPTGVWLVEQTGRVRIATPGLPAGLPDTAALERAGPGAGVQRGTVLVGGVRYQVRTERRGDMVLQAVLDLRANHRERDRLIVALLTTGGAGLLCAAVVGGWLGRRAVRPLESALALQRRFVADAGHDLRTPLTLLSTRAQLVRRRLAADPEAEVRADVDGLTADATRLTAVLEDLLHAADPRPAAAAGPVDLAALAAEVVAAAQAAAAERAVCVRCLPGTGTAAVLGSEAGLRRALTALLDNAVRYACHEVTVTVSAAGRSVAVEVADDGPGLDPVIRPRLFDRFASTGGAVDSGPRRYGLGLALAAEIAARHGGTVTACTGPGALLRITLPKAP